MNLGRPQAPLRTPAWPSTAIATVAMVFEYLDWLLVRRVGDDRQRVEFLPLSISLSDARPRLRRSSNAEGKNCLPRHRHHPCPPPPLMRSSRVLSFSRRRR